MRKIENRVGEENINFQGLKMTIIAYNNCHDIVVKFEDETEVKTKYDHFLNGSVLNCFAPSVYGVGITGDLYTHTKEYHAWVKMLQRCYSETYKDKYPTYLNVTCCDSWLYFQNFYEWLHSQENFEKWYINDQWHVDKDIIEKGNKVYSPDKCVLVPHNINLLLGNSKATRGEYPIGVSYVKNYEHYRSKCSNPFGKDIVHHGFNSPEEAFFQYKKDKEVIIKKVASLEYKNGNITKTCYEALMKYTVEITD